MKRFDKKLSRLERAIGLKGPAEIPLKDCLHTYIHREGESMEEINQQIAQKEAELVEKYGRRILRKLNFGVVDIVSSKHPMAEDSSEKTGANDEIQISNEQAEEA
ncbi:hypothetical protein ACFL0G_01590 [Candidatus Zixiibacteriota bacterium]